MDEFKSKSQKKREADALQDFGDQLIALNLEDLTALPLPERLLQAICDAKSIRSHGAARRQSQLVGKLLRSADYMTIMTAFSALEAESKAQTAQFHATETWRNKLIQGGPNELKEFIDSYRPDNVPLLRQLLKKAQTTANPTQQKTASKALFRYLRDYTKI
jgi:ribosome-associated protein